MPALPAMRSELCWTIGADERKDRNPPDQAPAFSGRLKDDLVIEINNSDEFFLPDEDQPGKRLTVILSNGFWQRRFAADRGIIGKTLTLNGNTFTIVGVMPRDFSLNREVMPTVNSIKNADLLVPLPLSESLRTTRTHEDYNIFGRLKSGITVVQAQADIDSIVASMKQQYPGNYPPNNGFTVSVVPLMQQVVGDIRRVLFVLLGAVGFVLLIACANVANLLLARAAEGDCCSVRGRRRPASHNPATAY